MSFTDTEVQEIIDEYNKEIEQLKLKIDRLVSRGIEDLRYENEELRAHMDLADDEFMMLKPSAAYSIAKLKYT